MGSECEHNWRQLGPDHAGEGVYCTLCGHRLFRKKDLAREVVEILADLGTMHSLKEQYRARAEKAEAEVERLKKEKENYRQSIFMIQQGTIKPEQVRL